MECRLGTMLQGNLQTQERLQGNQPETSARNEYNTKYSSNNRESERQSDLRFQNDTEPQDPSDEMLKKGFAFLKKYVLIYFRRKQSIPR